MRGTHNPGVVERRVEPSRVLVDAAHEGGDLAFLRDVHPCDDRSSTGLFDENLRLGETALVQVRAVDERAAAGELPGRLPADAGTGAGDQHDLVSEIVRQ